MENSPTIENLVEQWKVSKKYPEVGVAPMGYSDIGAWHLGLPGRPDNSKIPPILSLITALQYHKEKDYGSSWRKHGEYRSVIPNIDRKYDRLSKMIEDELAGTLAPLPTDEELTAEQIEFIGESKIDAAADLASYSILYLTYLS